MSDNTKKVSVQCLNDELIIVQPGHILMRCETLKKDVLQRLGQNDPEPIVVSKVDGDVMREIVEYCRVHCRAESDEQDLEPRIGRRQLNEYVQKFVSEKDANSLFSFIVAADHLKVSDLLDVLCEEVANRYIKGKTPEEIRFHLNIKNDWSEDEDERVLQVIESFQKGDQQGDKNYSMLHQLALEGDEPIVSVQKLLKALLDKGEDPNARESKDLTPLDMAAIMGHHHLLEQFIKLGADINSKDKTGKSALHKAAQNGKTQCVEQLIQMGCDVDALDNDGFAAVHYAAMAGSLGTMVAMAKLGCNYKIRAQGPLMSGCTAAAMYCMQRREVYKESLVEGRLARAAEEFRQIQNQQNQKNNNNNSPKGMNNSQNNNNNNNWCLEQVLQDLEPPQNEIETKKNGSSKKKKKKRKMAKQNQQSIQQFQQQNGKLNNQQGEGDEDDQEDDKSKQQNFSSDEDFLDEDAQDVNDFQSNLVNHKFENGIDKLEFASHGDIVNVAKQQQLKIQKQKQQQQILQKGCQINHSLVNQSWSLQNDQKQNQNSNNNSSQINSNKQQSQQQSNVVQQWVPKRIDKQKNDQNLINGSQKEAVNEDIVLENFGTQIAEQRLTNKQKQINNCNLTIQEQKTSCQNQLQQSPFQQFQAPQPTPNNKVPSNGLNFENSMWPSLSKQKSLSSASQTPKNGKIKKQHSLKSPSSLKGEIINKQAVNGEKITKNPQIQQINQNEIKNTSSDLNFGAIKPQYAKVAGTKQQQIQQQIQQQQLLQQQQDQLNEDFPPLSYACKVKTGLNQTKDLNRTQSSSKQNYSNSNLNSDSSSKNSNSSLKIQDKNNSQQIQSEENQSGYFSLFSHQIINQKNAQNDIVNPNSQQQQQQQLQFNQQINQNGNFQHENLNQTNSIQNPDLNSNKNSILKDLLKVSDLDSNFDVQSQNQNSNGIIQNLDQNLNLSLQNSEFISNQPNFFSAQQQQQQRSLSQTIIQEPFDQLTTAGLKYGLQTKNFNNDNNNNNINNNNNNNYHIQNNIIDPGFGQFCKFSGEGIFLCPLTQKLMKEPVIAADGHTYDLDAIWHWLTNNNTSPVSGEILLHKKLVPNLTLKQIISSLISSQQL